jgi:microcystin-dependent protein
MEVKMSEPFLGEIMVIGFNFAPRGWAFCDGQILPINQNQSLYSLLGTTYGGDGRTSFALPDLRSRTPVHPGEIISLGEKGGMETVTLNIGEMAVHSHELKGTTANGDAFKGEVNRAFATANDPEDDIYGPPANLTPMNSSIVTYTGGGQAHNNVQPMLVLNFVIALQGLFPSRN